jgi:phosphate starvation-inducible PhoH-like protein
MFLTRIGFGSKAVITGDVTQIDVPGGRSGLVGLEAILSGVKDLAFVHLAQRDVVRHRIVADIVAAYDRGPASDRDAVSGAGPEGSNGAARVTGSAGGTP